MNREAIHFLGTGGWTASHDRLTTCIVVRSGRTLLVLDAGSGLGRFLDPRVRRLAARCDHVCILLSHFHLDHTVGLTVVPAVFAGKRVTIYGPGRLCGAESTETVLARLTGSPLFALPIRRFPVDLAIRDFSAGTNQLSDTLAVSVRVQPHVDPSIGMRLEPRRVAFITDTACADETAEFAGGCAVLLHDAFFDDADRRRLSAHPGHRAQLREHGHASGVSRIAHRAKVGQAFLIHLNPAYAPARLASMHQAAARRFARLYLPADLDRIEV